MAGWTRFIISHRKKVIAAWVVVFVLGGAGASALGPLLTNRFSVPGSDAERGLDLSKKYFHERGDGAFTVVFQSKAGSVRSAVFTARAEAAAQRAARAIKGGQAGQIQRASANLAYVQITSPLENQDAADKTPHVRKAIGHPPGMNTYLSGFPAINHDTQPIYNKDLARGETIAIPIALGVLIFMFGTVGGIAVPLLFAFVSIPSTLGLVYLAAHVMDMAIYVENIVTLIGLAIAIDYSMLVVFRYREELEQGDDPHDALVRTMTTAGRATLFSGLTVAVGLALLVLMPLPFMRSMGVGGLLVPLVSIAASATFLPALLAVMRRGVNRWRVIPRAVLRKRALSEEGFWTRLASSIMRRPIPYLLASGGVMVVLAVVGLSQIHLTSGDNRGVPKTKESTKGLALLENTLGPGALVPNQVIVDTGHAGGAASPATIAAQRRFVAEVRRDREVDPSTIQVPAAVPRAVAERANLVDRTGRFMQLRVAGRSDSGTNAAVDLVHRLRNRYVPDAGFPGPTIYVTGAPAFGVDFIDKAYGAFPWLIVAVLVLSYLILLRAFRSVVLPIKAVIMNVLSVSATYGVLVLFFQHNWGTIFNLQQSPQIEAWIPIFLFAMLFGLSMDYEVFLLSRMREEWDKRHDNEEAVAFGLEHTGRIITAAAIIMVAAFSGFTFGSFVGLQEFGIGLSAAILLDATVVRAILVPATMKLIGDWNWYLPERVRRALRLAPPRRPAVAEGEGRG